MTLIYATETADPVGALGQVDQQSTTSSEYEAAEPLSLARAQAECIDGIIHAYSGTLSVVAQHEFWKELHRRLNNSGSDRNA